MDKPEYLITINANEEQIAVPQPDGSTVSRIGLHRFVDRKHIQGTFGNLLDFMLTGTQDALNPAYTPVETELATKILGLKHSATDGGFLPNVNGQYDTACAIKLEERVSDRVGQYIAPRNVDYNGSSIAIKCLDLKYITSISGGHR
jgi:hypothetical protein